jgi:hypothetical protein
MQSIEMTSRGFRRGIEDAGKHGGGDPDLYPRLPVLGAFLLACTTALAAPSRGYPGPSRQIEPGRTMASVIGRLRPDESVFQAVVHTRGHFGLKMERS